MISVHQIVCFAAVFLFPGPELRFGTFLALFWGVFRVRECFGGCLGVFLLLVCALGGRVRVPEIQRKRFCLIIELLDKLIWGRCRIEKLKILKKKLPD